jgi:hypothetical protein
MSNYKFILQLVRITMVQMTTRQRTHTLTQSVLEVLNTSAAGSCAIKLNSQRYNNAQEWFLKGDTFLGDAPVWLYSWLKLLRHKASFADEKRCQHFTFSGWVDRIDSSSIFMARFSACKLSTLLTNWSAFKKQRKYGMRKHVNNVRKKRIAIYQIETK